MAWNELVAKSLSESIEVKRRLLELADQVGRAGELVVETLAGGGRVYLVGNGGSAADAQHLAAELVGRFETDNRLPALALTTDTSLLTALANDFGFDQVFARQIEALAGPGDLLVALSTSGASANVLEAIRQARRQGLKVLGLAGRDGGPMKALCDLCLVVPEGRTCRIQEAHITLGHILCEIVEAARARGEIPGTGQRGRMGARPPGATARPCA